MHSYVLNMSLTKYQPPVLHLCALYKCILRDKSNFITSCAGWRGKSLETFSSQRCLIERKIEASSNLQSCLGGGSPPTSSCGGQVTTDAPARTSKSNPSHPGGRWSKAFPISDAANPLTHAIADNGFLQRHQWWEIGDTWLKRFWDNMTLLKDLKSRTLHCNAMHCCFAYWWSKSQKNVWLRGVGGNWSDLQMICFRLLKILYQ